MKTYQSVNGSPIIHCRSEPDTASICLPDANRTRAGSTRRAADKALPLGCWCIKLSARFGSWRRDQSCYGLPTKS